jgi:hypothetical protein
MGPSGCATDPAKLLGMQQAGGLEGMHVSLMMFGLVH